MTLTQKDIITILKTGVYPYSLQYFEQDPKFPIYPMIVVRKIQSDSLTTDVQKTQNDQTFNVELHIKYTRNPTDEEDDRLVIENQIKTVLENADIEPAGKIFYESKQWNTFTVDDRIFGSKSTLRFNFRDITSTTGTGIVGAGITVEINSQATPTTFQALSFSDSSGATIIPHSQDSGEVAYDPNELREGEFTVTYESNTTLDGLIKTIADNRTEHNGKLTRGGSTTNYTFLIGNTTKSTGYGDVERATTQFFITGTWV